MAVIPSERTYVERHRATGTRDSPSLRELNGETMERGRSVVGLGETVNRSLVASGKRRLGRLEEITVDSGHRVLRPRPAIRPKGMAASQSYARCCRADEEERGGLGGGR